MQRERAVAIACLLLALTAGPLWASPPRAAAAGADPGSGDPGATGPNRLRNAGFEDGLAGWRAPYGAWWDEYAGLDRSGALVIEAPAAPDDEHVHRTEVTQCVRLGPGALFELSAHFRFDRPPLETYANRAEVVWYETPDCSKRGQFGGWVEPRDANGWQSLSRRLRPAMDAIAARVVLVQRGEYNRGSRAFWDEVAFRPVASEGSSDTAPDADREGRASAPRVVRLSNGGFDDGLDGWNVRGDVAWRGREGASRRGAARVTLRSDWRSRSSMALTQCVELPRHRMFELGAHVKHDPSSTGAGGGRLRLVWYQEPGCRGRHKIEPRSADPDDAPGWQALVVPDLLAPGAARSARVEIIAGIRGPGEASVTWDDVYLEEVEPLE